MKVWDITPPKTWKWTDQDFHIDKLFRNSTRSHILKCKDYSVYQLLVFDDKKPTNSIVAKEIVIDE